MAREITAYVPHKVEERDFNAPDCTKCSFHPINHGRNPRPCEDPGMICGYYTPPWKPEKQAEIMEAFDQFRSMLEEKFS